MVRRRGPLTPELSERDLGILGAVGTYRLLSAGQIERLFFADHATPVAARRRCQAVLARLSSLSLLDRLQRRQGGWKAGSAGFVYRLTSQGQRVIGQGRRGARWEPSERWQHHTLDCAEIAVRLREAERAGQVKQLTVVSEPDNWRRFLGTSGAAEHLKPDLLVELTTPDEWELRWFVEIDRGTEHLPTVVRKCLQYVAYWQSGAEPHPIFPRVLWSVPDDRRADAVTAAIRGSQRLLAELFEVATTEQTIRALTRPPDQATKGGD